MQQEVPILFWKGVLGGFKIPHENAIQESTVASVSSQAKSSGDKILKNKTRCPFLFPLQTKGKTWKSVFCLFFHVKKKEVQKKDRHFEKKKTVGHFEKRSKHE